MKKIPRMLVLLCRLTLHDSVILVANNEEHAYCTSSYARDGVFLTRSQRG